MDKFKISGDFNNVDWIELRENSEIIKALTQTDNKVLPPKWKKAIEVFENRIQTRFLNPIEKIKYEQLDKGEGFSITLIAVVLMEAMAAFQFGKRYVERKANKSYNSISPSEYTSSAGLYRDLFKDSNPLNRNTNSEVRKRFYSYIRCGLVHEARTKGPELIISNTSERNTNSEKYYYKEGAHYIFNRDIFIDRLKEHFKNYLNKLNQPKEIQLRKNLVFKIDEICNIKHTWYFTYGSNLDEKQMNERLNNLGDFYLLKKLCRIKDYQFIYNKKSKDGSAKANIKKDNGKDVYGIAYLIREDTFYDFMKKYEKGYDVCELEAHYNHDKCFDVITAVSNKITDKLPNKSYLDKIINGAEEQGIDPDYIKKNLSLNNL
ncbi:gamma-glutamylcyclotransferase [Flavobacteriaceae bacterium]|nr:gamma-glutamylcyclotransferase [Flavobacteriaceae bacterium]